jgi:energy-coupling factor transporter transmembrane protein EcfT
MRKESNPPGRVKNIDRRPLMRLTSACALVITLLLISRIFLIAVPGADLLMFAAVMGLFFVSVRNVTAWRESAKWCRVCVLSLVTLVIAGQFTKRSEMFFPFVAWEMFSSVTHAPIAAVQLRGTLRDGSEIDFHPALDLTVVGESRIDLKIRDQVLVLERLKGFQPTALESEHRTTIRTLAMMYNRRHSANPITAVAVYKAHAVPPKPGHRLNPALKYLWTIPLGSES